MRLVVFLARRNIDGMVQPAIPARRRHRGLGGSAVDDPPALEAERRIDLAAFRAVVGVAELVMPNQFAMQSGVEQGVEGRPVPPGEEPQKKVSQAHRNRHPGARADAAGAPGRPYGDAARACPAVVLYAAPALEAVRETGLARAARLGAALSTVARANDSLYIFCPQYLVYAPGQHS